MARVCEACGSPAKSPRSRYCGSVECERKRARERKRTSRGHVIEFPAPDPTDGSVRAATEEALNEAGRIQSPLGRVALVLADRLDGGASDTGSSLASVAREWRATLTEALKDAPRAADAVDGIRGTVVRLRSG